MVAVCQGTKSKNDMIVEAVEQYKDMYVRAKMNFAKVISVMIGVNLIKRRLRLTHVRAFGSTSKEMVDRTRAEIIDGAAHREALEETTAMAAHLPLEETAGMEGMEEEDVRQREILGVPRHLDGRMPQAGQVELLLANLQDQSATATTVGLPCDDRFSRPVSSSLYPQFRSVGCRFPASSRCPRARPDMYTPTATVVSCAPDNSTTGSDRWP